MNYTEEELEQLIQDTEERIVELQGLVEFYGKKLQNIREAKADE